MAKKNNCFKKEMKETTVTVADTARKEATKTLYTGVQSIDIAIDHLSAKLQNCGYKKITASNANIAQYCYIRIESEKLALEKSKAQKEGKTKDPKSSSAEIALAKEQLEKIEMQLKEIEPIFGELVNLLKNTQFDKEISVYCYGTGDSVLHVSEDTYATLMRDMSDIQYFIESRFDSIKKMLASQDAGKKVGNKQLLELKEIKSNLQHAVNTIFGEDVYFINNNDLLVVCANIVKFDCSKDKSGTITKDSGLRLARKETLLRTLCGSLAMKFVSREIALQKQSEQKEKVSIN